MSSQPRRRPPQTVRLRSRVDALERELAEEKAKRIAAERQARDAEDRGRSRGP